MSPAFHHDHHDTQVANGNVTTQVRLLTKYVERVTDADHVRFHTQMAFLSKQHWKGSLLQVKHHSRTELPM